MGHLISLLNTQSVSLFVCLSIQLFILSLCRISEDYKVRCKTPTALCNETSNEDP